MDNTSAERLWAFFAEYYDDWINGQEGSLTINARTVRVLSRMYGEEMVNRSLRVWEANEEIRVFGNCEDLPPDAPCIELRGYPSRVVDSQNEPTA